MKLTYRKSADIDMESIRDFYWPRSQRAHEAVFEDIITTIDMVLRNPLIGRKLFDTESIRRVISPKYRFCISYIPSKSEIEIIGVFRYQNRII